MTIWEHGPWPAFSSLLLGIFSYVNWTTFFVAEFCRCESTEWAVYPSVARQYPDNPCSAYRMLYFGIYARWRPIHESDAAKWSQHGHLSMLSDPSPENPVSLLLMKQINGETDESDPENISWSLPVSFHLLWFVWPLRGCSELQS